MFAVGPLWRKLDAAQAKVRRKALAAEREAARRRAEAAEAERRAKLRALEEAAAQRVSARLIKALVAERRGFTVADMDGPSRKRKLVLARHEAMYLAAARTNLSYVQIGRIFGGRDHTTVLVAVAAHARRNGIDSPRVKPVSAKGVDTGNCGRNSHFPTEALAD
jgi:chromosomal replication initiation ATPase DnaA